MDVEGRLAELSSLPYEELVKKGEGALKALSTELYVKEGDAFFGTTMAILKVFVSADETTSGKEYAFFNDVMGSDWDYETFYEATNGGVEPHHLTAVERYLSKLTAPAKDAALTLCVCFLYADGVVSEEEKTLLHELFE